MKSEIKNVNIFTLLKSDTLFIKGTPIMKIQKLILRTLVAINILGITTLKTASSLDFIIQKLENFKNNNMTDAQAANFSGCLQNIKNAIKQYEKEQEDILKTFISSADSSQNQIKSHERICREHLSEKRALEGQIRYLESQVKSSRNNPEEQDRLIAELTRRTSKVDSEISEQQKAIQRLINFFDRKR